METISPSICLAFHVNRFLFMATPEATHTHTHRVQAEITRQVFQRSASMEIAETRVQRGFSKPLSLRKQKIKKAKERRDRRGKKRKQSLERRFLLYFFRGKPFPFFLLSLSLPFDVALVPGPINRTPMSESSRVPTSEICTRPGRCLSPTRKIITRSKRRQREQNAGRFWNRNGCDHTAGTFSSNQLRASL